VRWVRIAAAVAYVAVIVGFFVVFYADVRAAPPDTIVDATPLVVLIGLVRPVFGVLVGRPWALFLPFAALPVAALMAAVGAVDERYAPRRGRSRRRTRC
jgi:hypothetical protein